MLSVKCLTLAFALGISACAGAAFGSWYSCVYFFANVQVFVFSSLTNIHRINSHLKANFIDWGIKNIRTSGPAAISLLFMSPCFDVVHPSALRDRNLKSRVVCVLGMRIGHSAQNTSAASPLHPCPLNSLSPKLTHSIPPPAAGARPASAHSVRAPRLALDRPPPACTGASAVRARR